MKQWHAWLELSRISNLPTVWTNVLAGWLLAGGAWHWQPLTWLLAGASLLYTAGMILNDAMDVKFDREHRKERPIPSGRIAVFTAWSAGIAMMLSGAAMCFFGAGACVWLVLALVVAILAYDAYHKPWAGSVLIMGACRALLYLVAGSAVTGGLSWNANWELVVKAVALGCYIVGVSLVARSESASANSNHFRSKLGLLGLSLPLCANLIAIVMGPSFLNWLHNPAWWLAVQYLMPGVALAVVCFALNRMRTPPPSNIGRAVGLLLASIVVVDALAICFRHPFIALTFAAFMPLLLLWQRKISAT